MPDYSGSFGGDIYSPSDFGGGQGGCATHRICDCKRSELDEALDLLEAFRNLPEDCSHSSRRRSGLRSAAAGMLRRNGRTAGWHG
jgi:hypothetical protein